MKSFFSKVFQGIKAAFSYGKKYADEHPEQVAKVKEAAENLIKNGKIGN